MHKVPSTEVFVIKTGGKLQARNNVEQLINEWNAWLDEVKELPVSPDYTPENCTEAVKDGWSYIRRHEALREKTLVYLRNTFSGFEFILQKWPSHPHEDHAYSRLVKRVPIWISRLEMLNEALEYALIGSSEVASVEILNTDFWKRLHPQIEKIARQRFENKQYADSVEASLKEINRAVRQAIKTTEPTDLDGAQLMNRVFSSQKPLFIFEDLSTETGRSIQQGYMQIFAGAMTGIRNPKAHLNLDIDENRAIHFLFLASLLMFKLDEGRPVVSKP